MMKLTICNSLGQQAAIFSTKFTSDTRRVLSLMTAKAEPTYITPWFRGGSFEKRPVALGPPAL
jgi:hypothetical protein